MDTSLVVLWAEKSVAVVGVIHSYLRTLNKAVVYVLLTRTFLRGENCYSYLGEEEIQPWN